MKTNNIIIAHPQTDEQVNVIKAFMTAHKIKFEISKSNNETYNPEFVDKILQGKKDIEQGKGIKAQILEGLKEAVEQVNQAKKGKTKLKSVHQLLNEL